MDIRAPRGTVDILPGEIEKWQEIEKSARKIFPIYNYKEIRTPVFEDTSLFVRSIGSDTDIVEKEMYTFLDKKGRSLTLRPEGTAPVVRAYLEHNLYAQGGLKKFFYIGPFFRYERPQAGRNRQFYQVGAEAIGSDNPALDAEVIKLSLDFLMSLGLKNLRVVVNSIGCSACQPVYRKRLSEFLKECLDKLCDDCRQRAVRNPLRVLDCKKKECMSSLENAPITVDYLCDACRTHFSSVKRYLDMLDVSCEDSSRLVRGLDYYTRTTFEIIHSGLGAQNAVCGGGRFDGLVEEFGGQPVPAVGFAAGLDRIALIMDSTGIKVKEENPFVYVAVVEKEFFEEGITVLNRLRDSGVPAETDYEERSLKAQLRSADRLGVKFTIILGNDGFVLRDMEKGEQKEVRKEEIVSVVKKLIDNSCHCPA